MTQTFLALQEPLAQGAGVSLLSTDRGNVMAIAAVPSGGSVSPADVGAILLAAEANVRYVDKGGTAAGPGSRAQPFLTIQQALDAIVAIGTQSATNPWLVKVGVGAFADSFLYEPWINIQGQGASTSVNNPAAQQLSATFAAAGSQDTVIQHCRIAAPVNLDWTAMASPGAGRLFMADCVLEANVTASGNNASNRLFIRNCPPFDAVRTLTMTNITARAIGTAGTFTLNGVLNCTAGFNANFACDVWYGTIQINGTSATNSAFWTSGYTTVTGPTITGDRVAYSPGVGSLTRIFAPDADTQYVIGNNVVPGAVHAPTSGTLWFTSFATSPRTYTFTGFSAVGSGTRYVMKGGGVGGPMTLVGLGNVPSVVDPLQTIELQFDGGGATAPYDDQMGVVTLVNGVSPVITLDQPAILATFLPQAPHAPQATALTGHFTYAMNASTAIGELLITNINSVGSRAAGTSNFTIESRRLSAPGTVETGDQRTIMWRARITRQ